MKMLQIFLLLTLTLFMVKNDDDCFITIKHMASMDKCYCSRSDLKKEKAKTASNAQAFADSLSGIKCTNSYFSCGWTMSWVTEVYEGTNSDVQFNMAKYDDGMNGTTAGYKNYTGDGIVKLFTDNKAKTTNTIIYHTRMTGTQDHVFTVEQLANGAGYRIYQSYNDSHSLKAWLATDITGLTASGDITEAIKLKQQVADAVKSLSGGKATIDDLTNLPEQYKPLIPFVNFVKDYKIDAVVVNFTKAWNSYGKGKILSWTEFEIYVNNLKKLADYFTANDNTTNTFTQEIYDLWISMFGSINSLYYPNYPNNFLTSMLIPGRTFRFEILDSTFGTTIPCKTNAAVFITVSASLLSYCFMGLLVALIILL